MEKLFPNKIFQSYLQNYASMFFFRLSNSGEILNANKFAHQLIGKNIVGKNFSDFIFSPPSLNKLAKSADQEHLLNITTRTGLPQTYYFHFYNHDDKILAFGGANLDEVENLRQQLLSANSELTNLTRELHKANAELEKLNQLKNQFLGMAAHDLRKPVGAILNFSEFLIDEAADKLTDEHKQFLSIINSSSEFMAKIINDFLDVAMIESGKFEIEKQASDLLILLEKSLKVNEVHAKKKQIDLQFQIENQLPEISIDPSKIEQIFNNIVSNAIEHSEEGATVNIKIKKDDNTVIVSIKDQGDGIPKETLSQMFKPFGKAGTKKTGGEKSHGLGLAIAQKIVEAHGGKIWVESKLGIGSTFYFSLPIE